MFDYFIACLWGFAEATFFFFIPDIYLTRIALFDVRKALFACIYAAVSACAGGAVMYYLAALYPQQIMHFLAYIPAIFPKLIQQVLQSIQHQAFYALMMAPLKGIPYKIYAGAFGAANINFGLFMVASFFARLFRFILITSVGGLLAKLLKLYWNKRKLVYFHIYVWGLVYLIYFCEEVYYYF